MDCVLVFAPADISSQPMLQQLRVTKCCYHAAFAYIRKLHRHHGRNASLPAVVSPVDIRDLAMRVPTTKTTGQILNISMRVQILDNAMGPFCNLVTDEISYRTRHVRTQRVCSRLFGNSEHLYRAVQLPLKL